MRRLNKKKLFLPVLFLVCFYITAHPVLRNLSRLSYPCNLSPQPTHASKSEVVSVVIVMDPSDMINDGQKGQSTLLMAWNCYCLKHGYRLFYAPKVPLTNIKTRDGTNDSFVNRANPDAFYQGRLAIWRHYLRFTDILIVMDSDSVVVHHEKRLADFMSNPDDHVALQQRQNKAICAGTMMIRNSREGRAWLDRWYEDTTPHRDSDNGRLHSLVLGHYLNSTLGKQTSPEIADKLKFTDTAAHTDIHSYLSLFKLMEEIIGYRSRAVRVDGVLIYPSFGGFFRDFGFARQPGIEFWNEVPFNCVLDTDVVIHSKTSGPLAMSEDWACSGQHDAPFGSMFPKCNVSHDRWYQCQMTRHDRQNLVGSHVCQEFPSGICDAATNNLTHWMHICSPILGLE